MNLAQRVYSKMHMTEGSAQRFFGILKKMNAKQNRTPKIKSIKITDPKNKSFVQLIYLHDSSKPTVIHLFSGFKESCDEL